MGKDLNKRVNRNDKSLGLDGGSVNKVFKMKEEQLTIPGLKLPPLVKRKDKFKNNPKTSANVVV